MAKEFDKCHFCKSYDNYDGCTDWYCSNKDSFVANEDRIIEKAKEKGISVADVVALMNLEG